MNQAQKTLLMLGAVFTTLAVLLLGVAGAQLAFWWNRTLSGLTIEPVLVPMGLIFLAVGLPKLTRGLRERWLVRHGEEVDAEVLSVTHTRQTVDDRSAVMRLELKVRSSEGAEYTTRVRWPVGATAQRMVPGRRIRVRIRPGRPAWVIPA